jgi:uncharacterized OsmC-like protein
MQETNMVKMTLNYEGGLRCVAKHGPSGSVIETDAPTDNHGKGGRFSPTDLMGAALMSCIATSLGILAQKKGWNLDGMRLEAGKEMSAAPPRRVVRLAVELWMPAALPPEARREIEEMARNSPVHKSIHPDLAAPVTVHWPS